MHKSKQAEEYKEQGNQLARQKRYQKALEQYHLAISCDRNLAAAWFNKGLMHKKLSQESEAISAFQQALSLDPSYHKAQQNCGDILLNQGNNTEAWRSFYPLLSTSNSLNVKLGCHTCHQRIGAKIIFANVDLKLTQEGRIKILEFGNGFTSGFTGFDSLVSKGVYKLFITELKKFNLPVFINAPEFIPYTAPIQDQELKESLKPLPKHFSPEKISDYQAIYGGIEKMKTPINILKIGDAVVHVIFDSKNLTHRCFEKAKLLDYRPRACIFPRRYHSNLWQEIVLKFPNTTRFVLKAADLEGGKGVVVVDKEDLDLHLQVLLNENILQAPSNFIDYLTKQRGLESSIADDYIQRAQVWKSSAQPEFMVESYEPSKLVTKDMNHYDGTIRVAFMLIRDAGQYEFRPLAAYWKLPRAAVNQRQLRDCCISSYSDDHHSSLLLDAADQQSVFMQLRQVLPCLFHSMLEFNFVEHVSALPQQTQQQKILKANEWRLFACIHADQGNLEIADHYLNSVQKLTPNSAQYYHQLGVHQFLHQNYEQAITAFDNAIKIDDENAENYFFRGRAWLAKNQFEQASRDLMTAVKYNPRYASLVHDILREYGRLNGVSLV